MGSESKMGILLVDWQAQLSLSMVQQNDLSHFSSSGGGEGWGGLVCSGHLFCSFVTVTVTMAVDGGGHLVGDGHSLQVVCGGQLGQVGHLVGDGHSLHSLQEVW